MTEKEIEWKQELKLPCEDCGSSDAGVVYNYPDSHEKRGRSHHFHCFACGRHIWYEKTNKGNKMDLAKEQQNTVVQQEPEMLDTFITGSLEDLPERKLSKDTCKKFDIQVKRDHQGAPNAYVFNYYDASGQVVAQKLRNYSNKDEMRIKGKVKKAVLFGQQAFSAGGKYVTITVGEFDAPAAFQMTGSKWPCVSIKNGDQSAIAEIQKEQVWKWLDSFDNIVLCFDADDSGQKTVADIIKNRILNFSKLKIMKMRHKDANDYLMKGDTDLFITDWWNASKYIPKNILKASEHKDVALAPRVYKAIPYPWEGLNEMYHGIRTSELVTITAGCVDADTEFLTPLGWKKISEYTVGDKVAQYDKNTAEVSYTEPLAYIKKPCEDILHVETKYGIDQALTPEHRVLYVTENGIQKVSPFEEIVHLHNTNSTGFRGKFYTTFKESGKVGVNMKEDEIRLMVAVIADGHFRNMDNSSTNCYVRIKKERKQKRLRDLLIKLCISYTEKPCAPYDGFRLFTFRSPWKTKHFDETFWNMSKEQLKVVCEESLHWDGNQTDSFFSRDKRNADFIQYAFSGSSGKRASLLTSVRDDGIDYTVHVSDNPFVSFRKGEGEKPKITSIKTRDGYKYCFSVPKTFLVLRRNGNIFITGNTGSGKSTIVKTLAYHVLKNTGKDTNIGMLMLEEPVRETLRGLMTVSLNKNMCLAEVPDSGVTVSEEESSRAWKDVFSEDRVYVYGEFGSNFIDAIVTDVTYMAQALQCRYIFLDHVSIIVAGQKDGDERKALDEVTVKLRELCHSLDICIFMVCHTKRVVGTSHEEGGQTSLSDLRGTAGIGQMSDAVIGLERDQQAENPFVRNTTVMRVLKNRKFGMTGPAAYLNYDHQRGTVKEIDKETLDAELAKDGDAEDTQDKPTFDKGKFSQGNFS